MVDILNKFDIMTERLIASGKSHRVLRIPAFIAVMAVVAAEGIFEIFKKITSFLCKRRLALRLLSFAVAFLMFAPFAQPALIYASDNIPEIIENNSSNNTESPVVTEETTTVSDENTIPDETTISDENAIPEETTTVSSSEVTENEMPLMMALANDTVEISSKDELFDFFSNSVANSAKDIVLTADIDCEGETITPMASYSGTFDGQGYTISNLNIGKIAYETGHYASVLFQNITSTAVIKNIGFVNITASSTDSFGRAAVCAYTSSGKIENCYIINSSISGKSSGNTGYFVSKSGTVYNCYVANITSSSGIGNSNSATVFASPSSCTTDILNSMNSYAETSGCNKWYFDAAPDYSNSGYPAMKETYQVEFYKDADTKFTASELSFGGGKANAENYFIVGGGKIYMPDASPSMPRCEFKGWSLSQDASEAVTCPYTITNPSGTVKIYAVWDFHPTYTLTFLDKSDTQIDLDPDNKKYTTDEINTGETYDEALPTESAAERGYEFDGWYRTDTNTKWESGSSTVTKEEYQEKWGSSYRDPWEIEIKEKFKPIIYNINLDLNGGTLSDSSITFPIEYDIEESDVTLPEITRTGYIFKGWKVTDKGTSSLDETITTIPNDTCSDITVQAQWEAIKYKIRYNINATNYIADDNVNMSDSEHTYDTSENLTANTFKRNYYTFAGWAISEDGAVKYNDGDNVKNLSDTDGDVFNLYAVWTPVDYAIIYENGADGTYPSINDVEQRYQTISNSNPTQYNIDSGVITLLNPTCNGYTFKCWHYGSKDGPIVTTISPVGEVPNAVTLYGEWEPTEYTVTYDLNNGFKGDSFSLTEAYKKYNITTGLELPKTGDVVRSYYTFGGWKISGDCTLSGNTVVSFPKGTYGDATATAVWVPIEYEIEVNKNGGVIPDGSIPSRYTYETVLTLPIPQKTGYSFDGWKAVSQVESGGNFPVSGYFAKFEKNYGDVVLTADYTINQYTISFETNGGTEILPITEDYGTAVNAPDINPEKTGYDFIGWYEDPNFTTEYIFSTMPAEDITVYAKWEIKKYTVSFDTSGGSTVERQIVEYGSTPTRPQNPTKAQDGDNKFKFLGWYTDNTYTTPYDFTSPISDDVTVYANWLVYIDEPETYNASYKTDADSDNTVNIGEFVEGEQIVLPSIADDAINHRVFIGFILEGDSPEEPHIYKAGDIYTIGTEDVVFIIVWNAETHTVTFDSDGGSEVDVQVVEYNKKALEPSSEKRGFILKGWFDENDNKFSFDTPITEDIVLKAKWEKITIPDIPDRPGSGGGITYDKTIRITDIPDGISAPENLFKATADMDDFESSVDVRITNASEDSEAELRELLARHTDIPDEDIYIFDISLYVRGTNRKVVLPEGAIISLTIPVCDKFTSELDKVRVVSVHDHKLITYPAPELSSSGKYILVNFSSGKFSTFAFVLDRNGVIDDISASAPAVAAEMILYAPPAILPINNIVLHGRTKLRVSRKRKLYKVLKKFH